MIEKVVPCIEIVDDRWPDYKNENTPIITNSSERTLENLSLKVLKNR